MLLLHRQSSSLSATKVSVEGGADEEPPAGVTRDRHGLAMQCAQRRGRSEYEEALPVRDDGVRARRHRALSWFNSSAETLRHVG